MKKRLLLLSALFVVGSMSAQTSDLGNPLTFNGKIQKTKVFQEMPPLDIDAELLSQNQSGEKMLRFGKEFDVELNVLESATKTVLPSGDVLYQLGISCPNALSVNLVFSKFNLAAGSKLFLTDANSNDFIGSYTSFNNNPNQMLGTELLYSSKVIVELVEPKGKIGTSSLVISTVVAGFRNLDEMAKALNDAGNCHYDANCPQGAAWVNQKNSVAMMVNGGGFCTGALVNNTTGTIIPYFLSANHCGTNPGGWVFRFRWESPVGQTVCGTGGNSVNGPETMNVNGGTLRASWAGSDFTLTELNSAPNPAWGIYYSGWDNSNAAVTSAVGIHHPSGDIKKISFENDPLTSSSWSGTAANSHWHVPGWDLACTEPGSSGSPLFDQNHRVIGQLHGGASACGASDMSDEYGKFSVSWTGNGTNTTRLSNWLDPSNTGATAIEGVDPAGPAAALDAAINNPQGVSGTYCTATVTPQVTIMNSGTDVLTSATISYGYDGLLNQSYPWTGSLAQFASVTITLPAATLAGGNHTFDAQVINPNGSTDQNLANNTLSSSFTTVVNGQTATLTLNLDFYGSETSWEVLDGTSAVLYSGNGYSDGNGTVINENFCLDYGCYTFKIIDSYGDGMSGQGASDTDNGSYVLTYGGLTVAEMTQANAVFGTENSQTFCLTVGLDEFDLSNFVNVFPNPADELVSVVSKDIQIQKVELMNVAGQVIDSINSNDMVVTMNVGHVASGVYFIRISALEGTSIKQVVIK